MKYVDEFRDGEKARILVKGIHDLTRLIHRGLDFGLADVA
jgi:hypothetical protein